MGNDVGTKEYRTEHDTMGEVQVPAAALYAAQTQRAVENFPISGRPIEPAQIRALGLVKGAAARVNSSLGVIDAGIADAISAAADEAPPARTTASSRSTSSRPGRAPART